MTAGELSNSDKILSSIRASLVRAGRAWAAASPCFEASFFVLIPNRQVDCETVYQSRTVECTNVTLDREELFLLFADDDWLGTSYGGLQSIPVWTTYSAKYPVS